MTNDLKTLEDKLQETKDLLDSKKKVSISDYKQFGDATRELETIKKQENGKTSK